MAMENLADAAVEPQRAPLMPSVTWAHIGDIHADEDDRFEGVERLRAIVAELNGPIGADFDFVFLPGDNANHGTAAQYEHLLEALGPLRLPWRIIPGDHDFEHGNLDAYKAAIRAANRPDVDVIAGHRCVFLDIVSAGAGGPDFRLTMHDRRRLAEELGRAEAGGEPVLVFMHAYPGDLAADGAEVARLLADARVAFVSTGHTHYNELLNDGRVLYGATRSTGQIEEGPPGYTIVTVRNGVVSWHFRHIGKTWATVRIIAPADLRLVTRPFDARQVPQPGAVEIVAHVMGKSEVPLLLSVDGSSTIAMAKAGSYWAATVFLASGLHRVIVTCGHDQDTVDVLVRPLESLPKQPRPIALGHAVHTIGAWPDRGILGTRLGPNRNGGAS